MMMRWMVRWSLLLAPLLLVGCASDPREAKITAVIGYVNNAATEISAIKDNVASAVKKADNKKLDSAEMKKALPSIENLKNLTKEMQKAKQQIATLAETTPKDERDKLAEQFRGKLSAALARLDEERRALEKTILEAEALDNESVKDLRSKLTEAEGNFVMLARQR
jgi:hypothetical protein